MKKWCTRRKTCRSQKILMSESAACPTSRRTYITRRYPGEEHHKKRNIDRPPRESLRTARSAVESAPAASRNECRSCRSNPPPPDMLDTDQDRCPKLV